MGVTDVGRAVAVQAVVDEISRTALQRGLVFQVDRRAVEMNVFVAGSPCGHSKHAHHQQGGGNQGFKWSSHQKLTRFGSGFSLSFAVYQGISTKKRKYTVVKIRATMVATSRPPMIGSAFGICPQTVVGTTPRWPSTRKLMTKAVRKYL